MRILFYKWKVFNQDDVFEAFEYFGHTVEYYTETFLEEDTVTGVKTHDFASLNRVFSEYDCVFSLNYFSHVSDVCEKLGKKYIAWTVDSPLISLYHKSLFNKCNYIFIFDEFFYYELKDMGVKNVWYLPLAVNTDRLDLMLSKKEIDDYYRNDVSFVGGMYHKNSYDRIRDKLSPYLAGYFDAALYAQMQIYGDNIFDNLLTVDILAKLCEEIDFRQDEDAFSNLSLVFSSTFLGFKLANLERVKILNMLAKSFDTVLYCDEPDDNLSGVTIRKEVSYMEEMPMVFAGSRINLNPVMRNIRTGIPLRAWDILGAGGFLLSSFQVEMLKLFENGKNMVFYESHDDLLRKTEYYLNHEDERCTIAKNGHDLVKSSHTYLHRVSYILKHIV